MGFTEILTILFIALKLLGVISWSWFYVLLPEIIALVLYIVVFIVGVLGVFDTHKRARKHIDKWR